VAAEPRQLTIVGAGELTASSYLPAAALLGWRAVLVDRDLDRARRLASGHRRVVDGVSPSLDQAGLSAESAVLIATPARTHADLALAALDAGAGRLLIEKPPTTSRAEYDRVVEAAEASGATIRTSFIRRAFQSVRTAHARAGEWSSRFGPLRRISFIDGSPWGWKSMATRERGAEGLEEILLDELSHGFDSVFFVAGWQAPSGDLTLTVETSTRWEFRGSANGSLASGELALDVTVSRTQVLANAIVLEFEGASVCVEYTPAGGVVVRPHSGPTELIDGPSELESVAERFAKVLRGAFTPDAGETSPPLSEWEGPVSLISGFREAALEAGRVEGTA
jgi:predicted dehydrogenase